MAFEILTDEIKHAIKYNYILNTTHKKKEKLQKWKKMKI
ncbi:hypothetical protein CBF_1399 [Clostridium botulinum F str. 230613]|uniref:Uncharacterized protein n=1 Tax=Clostridium botulinum (strain Langeland / NCTC 10281 / Type F) TaxID=441772 RepID=A7GD28_CLOBL|nr:hypothetical protein CLI_1423 [Clostridium botulinum F str. Langeland]ADF99139.1 hypothetical protein CBF_1399 [Clostridium botulinum F str. 230613]